MEDEHVNLIWLRLSSFSYLESSGIQISMARTCYAEEYVRYRIVVTSGLHGWEAVAVLL